MCNTFSAENFVYIHGYTPFYHICKLEVIILSLSSCFSLLFTDVPKMEHWAVQTRLFSLFKAVDINRAALAVVGGYYSNRQTSSHSGFRHL